MSDNSGNLSWGTTSGSGAHDKSQYDSNGDAKSTAADNAQSPPVNPLATIANAANLTGSVGLAKIAPCANGQVLMFSAGAWSCQSNVTLLGSTIESDEITWIDAAKITSGTLNAARIPI